MQKIGILTDSTCSLTLERMSELGVTILPLSVVSGSNEYLDLIDIDNDMIIKMLQEGALPKTSQPSVGLINEKMQKMLVSGYEALIIFTIHGDLSGTYANTLMAVQNLNLENVHVVDTRSASYHVGYMVELAAKMVSENKTMDEILTKCRAIINAGVTYIVPKELDTLKRGGRISKTAATVSSLLKLKPILILEKDNQSIEKFGVARTQSKIYSMILDDLVKRGVNETDYFLSVPYVDEMHDADEFMAYAKSKMPKMELIKCKIPAVITTHVGRGAFGVQAVLK